MERSFRSGLLFAFGTALLAVAFAIHLVLLETVAVTLVLAAAGALLAGWGAFGIRRELGALLRRRRSEIALFTLGAVGVIFALGYLSVRFPLRFDLTEAGLHSLSEQTVTMLRRLETPVHVVFFHDPLMDETVELYELMAAETQNLTVEFHDPTLNPAQARLLGVKFAGTSVMRSEDRVVQIHGATETDIANGILRVSQSARQLACFLDGHGEADPFSLESHDHREGDAGHSHGLGSQYVLHERHGLAKARHGLEAVNYTVEKVLLAGGTRSLSDCSVLVVAGPKTPLLPDEIEAVRAYLAAGGNALFMLDPFVETGLEPLIRSYGVVVDDTIVIDRASHFWSDVSTPAVTTYNRHQVTRDLPLTFFPGARSLSPTPERVPGTAVTALVNSSTNSYGETTPDRADFDDAADRAGPLTLMAVAIKRPRIADATANVATAGDDGSRTDAAEEARVNAESRIAVIGDSDFATNSFFHFLGNGNLFLNAVNYLAARENLIGIEPRTYDLPELSVTNRQMKATFILSMGLVPGLLALIGFVVWWRQR